jgi:hypothetical protein
MDTDFRKLIQTERLTAKFCMEVILNDLVKKSPEDSCIGEGYILKYQEHITEEDLDAAWSEYQTRNKKERLIFFAEELTRPEKIVLLQNKYKTIFARMTYEGRNAVMRKMIRQMGPDAWSVMLQEKVFPPYKSVPYLISV